MIGPLEQTPSKIVCVHLNYKSRAAERGRAPAYPTYFLKAPSTLSAGGAIARPPDCELLAFEGEVALVIGTLARRVRVDEAWGHVAFVTAANDFGVYDLRYADNGSNLRSKGSDGFTPVGPRLLDASKLDPDSLLLRTYLNGEVVQDAELADDLLFSFALVIADLTRLMTLEEGDLILTGTPTGSTVVVPGDVVEVEVSAGSSSTGRLRSEVVQQDGALEALGAMPRVDDETRAAAYGAVAPRG